MIASADMMPMTRWFRTASGNIGSEKRTKPYVPIFSRTAARMTEPAVGASVCASGSHVWNGNIGTLIAKPKKKAKKSQICSCAGIPAATAVSDSIENVGRVAEALVTHEPGRVVEVERDDAEQHQHRARPACTGRT